MPEYNEDQELIDQVSRSDKYAQLAGTLVSRITKEESKKHKSKQDIIQSARTRLHQLTGGVSTLLEWDAEIPEFPVVHAEVLKARQFMGAAAEIDAAGQVLVGAPQADVRLAPAMSGRHGGVSNPLAYIVPPVR